MAGHILGALEEGAGNPPPTPASMPPWVSPPLTPHLHGWGNGSWCPAAATIANHHNASPLIGPLMLERALKSDMWQRLPFIDGGLAIAARRNV